MAKPNYTRAYLNEIVRFMDQRTFTVYDGKRLALIGCTDQGGIPSELHPNQVVSMQGGITLEWQGRIDEYPLKRAPRHWEFAGREWLQMAYGITVDTLPEGKRVTPFTLAWLKEEALFLDEDTGKVYRGTNLELLGASWSRRGTRRVTPAQIVRHEGNCLVLKRGWREETYSVSELSDELRQGGLDYLDMFADGFPNA